MEPSPSVRYTPHHSKKRVFSGASGSSSFMDQEVIQLDQPPSAKSPKSMKQKEVSLQEIIDIDDDDDDDVIILEEKSVKGKQAITGGQEDISSDMAILDDYYGDMAYDDVWYDDECAMLQAHFDSLDIPPGVEAAVPWWPNSSGSMMQAISSSSSHTNVLSLTDDAISKISQPEHWKQDEPSLFPKPVQNFFTVNKAPSHYPWSPGFHAQPGDMFPFGQDTSVPPWLPSPFFDGQYPSEPLLTSMPDPIGAEMTGMLHVSPSFPSSKPIVGGNLKKFPSGYFSKTGVPIANTSDYMPYLVNPSVRLEEGIAAEITVPSNFLPSTVGDISESPILSRLELFKKFDTVLDHSDHHYSNKKDNSRQPSKNWVKKIQEEWRILEKDLPDTIFVRVYETRMDLMRAAIMGADGTPYHDGIFFFDIFFPTSYPNAPPHVHYHSGGLRLNPNLYNCGKVCLSLLNTWSGDADQKWRPGFSTMLQVLVSVQGLILNAKPYFNEPGYQGTMGTVHGEKKSEEYNENTLLLSLKTMLYSMRKPPMHFEDFVFGHFFKHAHDILSACKAYLGGTEVGSLVKGVVEDGDSTDKKVGSLDMKSSRCSQNMKMNLPNYIKSLVEAFNKIGVKDCEKFIVPNEEEVTTKSSCRHSSKGGGSSSLGGSFNYNLGGGGDSGGSSGYQTGGLRIIGHQAGIPWNNGHQAGIPWNKGHQAGIRSSNGHQAGSRSSNGHQAGNHSSNGHGAFKSGKRRDKFFS